MFEFTHWVKQLNEEKKTTEDERKTFCIIDLNMNIKINGTQYFDRNQFEKKNNIDYKIFCWF